MDLSLFARFKLQVTGGEGEPFVCIVILRVRKSPTRTHPQQPAWHNTSVIPPARHHGSHITNARAGAIQGHGGPHTSPVSVEAAVPFLPVPRDDDDWRYAHSFHAERRRLRRHLLVAH